MNTRKKRDGSTQQIHGWVFPKNRGSPKWMFFFPGVFLFLNWWFLVFFPIFCERSTWFLNRSFFFQGMTVKVPKLTSDHLCQVRCFARICRGSLHKNQKEFCFGVGRRWGVSGCSIFMWNRKKCQKGWHELYVTIRTLLTFTKKKKNKTFRLRMEKFQIKCMSNGKTTTEQIETLPNSTQTVCCFYRLRFSDQKTWPSSHGLFFVPWIPEKKNIFLFWNNLETNSSHMKRWRASKGSWIVFEP